MPGFLGRIHMVPHILLPPAGGPDPRLPALLEEGWRSGMGRGAIAYDPGVVEVLQAGPTRFLLLPGREDRPRPPEDGPGSLRKSHYPCPFDTEDFLAEREVVRVSRHGRTYHLALNKFPVMPLHYLAVRPAGEPPETLPQRLGGEEEIGDMLVLAARLGRPWRLFFNSNRGADGSRSGSSVNHWHFQLFPTDHGAILRDPNIHHRRTGRVEIGEIPDWPAGHRLYRSGDPADLARAVWADLARIEARDAAYNVEIDPRPDGSIVAILFPRAPTGDLVLDDGRVLSGNFGGFELSGNVVVPSRPVFDWIRRHPASAEAIIAGRIRTGTAAPPILGE